MLGRATSPRLGQRSARRSRPDPGLVALWQFPRPSSIVPGRAMQALLLTCLELANHEWRSMSRHVAIVTGGSSGIGLASAQELYNQGFDIVICARNQERIDAALARIGLVERVHGVAADVSEPDAATRVIEVAVSRFGRLDTVVNAAGVTGEFKPLELLTPTGWRDALEINLLGAVYTTTAAVPHMRAGGGGTIVNVSSIAANRATLGTAQYGVSKAALDAFTRYAAYELAEDGIRVNGVAPGWIRTEMAEPFIREAGVARKAIETNFLGRVGEASEMGKLIAFLAGSDSSFITGETVVADGGQAVKAMPLRPLQGAE